MNQNVVKSVSGGTSGSVQDVWIALNPVKISGPYFIISAYRGTSSVPECGIGIVYIDNNVANLSKISGMANISIRYVIGDLATYLVIQNVAAYINILLIDV